MGGEADHFAARLKELREAAGLTQKQLAEESGFTREGVAQLETGRRKPAWETVLALAAALGVSCEDFHRPPAEQHEPKKGRPPKPAAVQDEPAPPKRPRGRPRKADAPDVAPDPPEPKKPRSKGKGK